MTTTTHAGLDERLAAWFASDPDAIAGSVELLRDVREQAPVYEFESAHLVLRYAEAKAVIRDNRVQMSRADVPKGNRARAGRSRLTPEQQRAHDEVMAFEGLQLSRTDPPQHDRLRRIAHRAFTPARIAAMRDTIQRYTDELLEPLAAQDVADLRHMAYRLPLMIVSDLLGVPEADRDTIHAWTAKIARNKGGTIVAEPVMEARSAIGSFNDYVTDLVEEHRRSAAPVSDLVGALIDAEADERLSTEELAAMFVVLLFGGHETTTNLISLGMLELLRRPEQWRRLTDDPELARPATEELLRFTSPVQWLQRVAVEDIELAGAEIRAGDNVYAMLAAANRDPEVFPDPDRLDVTRPEGKKHIALGFGPYFCLGASLARMEGAVAFETIARRYPGIELATDEVRYEGSALLRTLTELPVRLNQ